MNKKNIFGIIFSVIVSIVFVLAIISWLNLFKNPEISEKLIKDNELATYQTLKKIAIAQEKYIKEDWDGDGKYEYSLFLVHLWKTITSTNGDSKLLGFIPKEIGYATESSYALDGYVYMMLHDDIIPGQHTKRIDYTKRWAIFAAPKDIRRTGYLRFIIDQEGKVFVSKDQRVYNSEYPYQALQNGWVLINSIDDLKNFQEDIEYVVVK